MPRIFDNINQKLLLAIQNSLDVAFRSDFCVGYFNLRGWKSIDQFIEKFEGNDEKCCRLLIGMYKTPDDEIHQLLNFNKDDENIDNQTVLRLKKKLAEDFRNQLTIGTPTNEDEAGLRRLAKQLKRKKVVVKLFLRHQLHAKLYLFFRKDIINPKIGYVGSSNLTFSGLSNQGELNVDVLDDDACEKLSGWFDDRWNDNRCIDISKELIEIIEQSWAREELIPPYHIYLKIAYHLSQEARAGLSEFRIPSDFKNKLFEYQSAAVKIAAHHLHKRKGVIIGDVVGLGKTLMASAVARIFEDDLLFDTLIICPKNLVPMWENYRDNYRMRAKVMSISKSIKSLPDLRRYKLVIIDESHNLRNREGKIYKAIKEYLDENESFCILLSATPYNKSYLDLSSQLRLFVSDDRDIGIRPEFKIKESGEDEFISRHQCGLRTLAAFEKSEFADDWRELMRLYMVRRTRGFIKDNYAITDKDNGRKYLLLDDGSKAYFPDRIPKTLKFKIDEKNPEDKYAMLFNEDVIKIINDLNVPRYGLGIDYYKNKSEDKNATVEERKQLDNLSRAGKRLMGFSRANLFKRLESSGNSFLLSIKRHIIRNYIFLYAIENSKPFPIGTLDFEMLDTDFNDEDADISETNSNLFENEDVNNINSMPAEDDSISNEENYKIEAETTYKDYSTKFKKRYKWIDSKFFNSKLKDDLLTDIELLFKILDKCKEWDPDKDEKLKKLTELISKKHPEDKILIFSQFADTVNYLTKELKKKKTLNLEGVTGSSENASEVVNKFSPVSNDKADKINKADEVRILIATDILSEGQNLQDSFIVVNFDLPWAIIKLIQRAGRVDRIGQKSDKILCYSFLPADGVEKIIKLRQRVKQRLKENVEVVGSDESFFEDEENVNSIRDLFTEHSGILDGESDTEVDLSSYAYQIWKNALEKDPSLQKIIADLPDVVYSTKNFAPKENENEGVIVYLKTPEDNDALAWIDLNGKIVTESQLTILNAVKCEPETKALKRFENHHELVKTGIESILSQEKAIGGGLGKPSGARFKTYQKLKAYIDAVRGTIFENNVLHKTLEEIYTYPLRQSAIDTLNRQLKSGIAPEELAKLVTALREDDRLCIISDDEQYKPEPKIICSMGMKE